MSTLTVKITNRQLETLKALAERGAKAHYMPYMGRFNPKAYWFVACGRPCTQQVERLLSLGFAERINISKYDSSKDAVITKAGRAYLKKHAT